MKTTPTARQAPQGGGPRSAWNRFWFTPTDPATFGFMRVVTGLLVIYIHLAYCYDLNAFFGRDGWWSVEGANRQRREEPIVAPPIRWDPADSGVRVPEMIHLRKAVIDDFFLKLPDSRKDREAIMRFVAKDLPSSPDEAKRALDWVRAVSQVLPPNEDLWREFILGLLFPSSPAAKDRDVSPPTYYEGLSTERRGEVVEDVLAFIRALPSDPFKITYIIAYFADMSPGEREETLKFINAFPEDRKAREERIRFIDYWGTDRDVAYTIGRPTFSLWFHLNGPNEIRIAHAVIIGIFVLFTIGLWTRVTAVLTWLAICSYLHRTQQVLFGMDQMMNILVFYMVIGNAGAAFSVDRLIARFRAARALAKAGGQPVPWAEAVLAGPAKSVSVNLATRMLQVHFCFIYMSAGLSKLKGTSWWDHSAPWFTLANPEFSPLNLKFYEALLSQLSHFRWAVLLLCTLMVAFTLFTEIGFAFLVWTRMRPFIVSFAIAFHCGIAAFMGLTLFGLLMMTMLLAYFPAALIRQRIGWPVGSGPRLLLRFNSADKRQARTAAMVRAFDVANQVEWRDEPMKTGEPVRVTVDGKDTFAGRSLFDGLLNSLVLLRSVSWLRYVPGVAPLGRMLFGVTGPGSVESSAKLTPSLPARRVAVK